MSVQHLDPVPTGLVRDITASDGVAFVGPRFSTRAVTGWKERIRRVAQEAELAAVSMQDVHVQAYGRRGDR